MSDGELIRIAVALEGLTRRHDAMETARNLARIDQEDWKREMRDELHEIREQTTTTNGRLKELELWRARLNGIATVFAWWKPAVATLAASGVIYFVVSLATR